MQFVFSENSLLFIIYLNTFLDITCIRVKEKSSNPAYLLKGPDLWGTGWGEGWEGEIKLRRGQVKFPMLRRGKVYFYPHIVFVLL